MQAPEIPGYELERVIGRGRMGVEGIGQKVLVEGEYPVPPKGGLIPIGAVGAPSIPAKLSLTGGNLKEPLLDVPLMFLPNAVPFGGPLQKLGMQTNRKTGTFTGSFQHPATNQKVKFSGAFRPRSNASSGEGRGVFTGASESGTVRIVPN